jgi:ribonuclease HI
MSQLINAITPQSELIIHTDGGSRGNPGPSAVGVVITTPGGDHLESFGEYIGETTNNQAEYSAVVAALKAATKYQPKKIDFYLDSELVVKQLKGEYRVKNSELKPLYADIIKSTSDLDVSFSHVLREHNKLADIEVNKALDEQAANA